MSQYTEWVVVTDTNSLLLDNLDGTATNKIFLLNEAGNSKNTNLTWIPLHHILENDNILRRAAPKQKTHPTRKYAEQLEKTLWQGILDNWVQSTLSFLSTALPFLPTALTFLSMILAKYENVLVQYPAVTKSITAAVVSFVGDLMAQAVENRRKAETTKRFDLYRSFSLAAEGLFISGPLLHYAYDSFEGFMTSWEIGNIWVESVVQTFMDIIVLDAFFTGTLMVTSAALQGHDIFKELKNDYIPAVYVAWLSSFSMAPLQLMNFGIIPLRYRVLVTNFQDVLWNAAVSTMAHRSRQ